MVARMMVAGMMVMVVAVVVRKRDGIAFCGAALGGGRVGIGGGEEARAHESCV